MRRVNREYKGPQVIIPDICHLNIAAPALASTPALTKLLRSNGNNNKTYKPKKPTKRNSIMATFHLSIENNTQEAVITMR